jgi:hypothetical protein
MALIKSFSEKPTQRNVRHTEVTATWTVVEMLGETYLQIDTYGSSDRMIAEKVSQSIRLDANAASQLRALIDKAFPALGSRAASRT